jgi:hypothetical protein
MSQNQPSKIKTRSGDVKETGKRLDLSARMVVWHLKNGDPKVWETYNAVTEERISRLEKAKADRMELAKRENTLRLVIPTPIKTKTITEKDWYPLSEVAILLSTSTDTLKRRIIGPHKEKIAPRHIRKTKTGKYLVSAAFIEKEKV